MVERAAALLREEQIERMKENHHPSGREKRGVRV